MDTIELVIETIKAFVSEKFIDFESQMKWRTDFLAQLLDKTAEHGQSVVIDNKEYLNVFGFPGDTASAAELWHHITERIIRSGNIAVGTWRREIDVILQEGTLSQRILRALGKDHTRENITVVYKHLCDCLAQNRMFIL